MVRVALLGAGFIGSVHAASVAANPRATLTHVFDVEVTRAEELADRYGAQACGELASVLRGGAVEAVIIASSTDTHAALIRQAADAGLAIFCEKPIDLDFAAAAATVAHARTRGARAMVDFNRRFDRDYTQLKRVIEDGQLGTVELIRMSSRGPQVPPLSYVAVSGGQMRDQAVHFFDLTRWLTGLDPVEAFAAGSALADPAIADYADVDTSVTTLGLPGGALAQIDCIRRTGYGYDERIEVFGSAGLAEARPHRTGSVRVYRGTEVVDNGLPAGWFERVQAT